jgi:hypothetical protein
MIGYSRNFYINLKYLIILFHLKIFAYPLLWLRAIQNLGDLILFDPIQSNPK